MWSVSRSGCLARTSIARAVQAVLHADMTDVSHSRACVCVCVDSSIVCACVCTGA
jgi:hypothetical protein